MNSWMIILAIAAAWWYWPKLSSNSTASPTSNQPRPLDNVASELAASLAPDTASGAFRAMETVRDRMLDVGATDTEVDQLTQLAPVLLRKKTEA